MLGPLDDVVAVVLLLRYAARAVPRRVLLEAWPEDPRLLERVLDGRRGRTRPPTRPRVFPRGGEAQGGLSCTSAGTPGRCEPARGGQFLAPGRQWPGHLAATSRPSGTSRLAGSLFCLVGPSEAGWVVPRRYASERITAHGRGERTASRQPAG